MDSNIHPLFPARGMNRPNQSLKPQVGSSAFAIPVQQTPVVTMTSPAPPERKRLKSIGSADAFVMDPFLDFEGFTFRSPNCSPDREVLPKHPSIPMMMESFTYQAEKNKQMGSDILTELMPEEHLAHPDDLGNSSQYLLAQDEVPMPGATMDLQAQGKHREIMCGVPETLNFSKFMDNQSDKMNMQMPAGIGSNFSDPVRAHMNHPGEGENIIMEAPSLPLLKQPMPDVFEKLATFVAKLSATPVGDNACNQYSILGDVPSPDNEIRRQNLFLYLKQMHEICNGILLVGQACFSKGCRLTGVPFTSEWILLNPWTNAAKVSIFGKTRGFKKTSEFAKVTKEASAKIVWKALVDLNQVPLLWHIFPFHPYDPKKSWLSNRSPNNEEMKIGETFLKELIQIFNIQTILALGKFVKRHLENMDIPYIELSRPSYSGKRKFVQGIRENLK